MTDLRSPMSVVSFAIYKVASGAIRQSGRVFLKDLSLQTFAEDEALVEGQWDFATDYVDLSGPKPEPKPRPVFTGFDRRAIKADGNEVATLALPVPATVTIDGHDHAVPAGPLQFRADSPGSYRIEIEAWPYMPYAVIVEAS